MAEDNENAFDVSQFKSAIKHDYHFTSHFNLQFNVPPGLTGPTSSSNTDFRTTAKQLMFEVEASNSPGLQIATDEVFRHGYGTSMKKPYAPIFNKVDILVRSDATGFNFDYFESWLKLVVNFDMRHGINYVSGFKGARPFEVNYMSDYATEVVMTTFDKTAKIVKKIYLRKCYPVFLGDVLHDWSDANKIVKMPVSLVFSDWYQERFIQTIPNEVSGITNVT